jgi:NADP-dependent 3-hydroxy acid dehydrogenase YdfG
MNIKTLFITGASSGIGAFTARAATKAGWNVALVARRTDKLNDLVSELGSEKTLAIPGDVTNLADMEQAVQKTVEKFGGIDAAFANAGTGVSTPGTEQGDPEEWRKLVDINIMGVLYTSRVVLPELRKTKGTLVLTGSAAGRNHIKGSIYGASKWFVHGYAGNMAEEMREWGGRCSLIAPGMVDTAFFDSPKPDKLQAEDVAAAVVHAISAPDRAAVREIFLMPQN